MNKNLAALVVMLAGCVPLHSRLVGKQQDIVVYPMLKPETQAIVSPNTLSSIATLDIVPYVLTSPGVYNPISSLTGNPTDAGAPDVLRLSQASPSIDPSRPFVIRALKPNKNYRVFGRAYNAQNALISKDLTSYVDVEVGNNDAPAMATLPVNLLPTSFAANAAIALTTLGRYDYLKSTLYLLSGNAQIAVAQTTRVNPQLSFSGLQANTDYKLVAEAYKLGTMMASSTLGINVGQDDAPPPYSLILDVPYVVNSIAGSGTGTFGDGPALSASFYNPWGIVFDPAGNLYIADRANHRIRKLATDGVVSTFAGSGTMGFLDGTGTAANFNNPVGIKIDAQGNLYVSDYNNHCIRMVTPGRVVSTVAGNGTAGYADGTGTLAQFRSPYDITLDLQGNIIVADQLNHRIRRVTPGGVVTTIAGNGTTGATDGTGTSAMFKQPVGVTVDAQGNIFVGDWTNYLIRKITPQGVVTTFAGNGVNVAADGTGTAAGISQPTCVAFDPQGYLYVVEHGGNAIRRISPNAVVTTIAGNATADFAEGTGTSARFHGPLGIAIDPFGYIYIADYYNHRIRKLN